MDRPQRRPGLLNTGGAAALATVLAVFLAMGAAPLGGPPPLRAMRWLAPGADAARILTHTPVECLTRSRSAEDTYRVEIGRAALRTPLLLGGQAARAGIACATCHRNGRSNPDFDFPGVSGAPGTADVTSSLFSAHRGDDIDDPRPIPDLGGPKDRLKISQAEGSPALKIFIRGLVTEEFDGPPPPPAVLDGLVAYVRALNPKACGPTATAPMRASSAAEDVRRAVRAAQAALARGDAPTAQVMVESARSQLGDIAERYAGADVALTRRRLGQADLDLAAALESMRSPGPTDARERLATFLARSDGWMSAVTRDEARSLYDPGVIAARLAAGAATPRHRPTSDARRARL